MTHSDCDHSGHGGLTNTKVTGSQIFLLSVGIANLLDTTAVRIAMADYLEQKLTYYVEKKRSRQTMETLLAAMGKLQYAINTYITEHSLDVVSLDTERLRLEYYARSKRLLRKTSRTFSYRAYPDPIRLIEAISDKTYQLQASLQYEGGLRAEGVGAPSHRRVKNPLTCSGLHGIGIGSSYRWRPLGLWRLGKKGVK